ncbi:hypothetical protein SFR_3018 [Streptomyces sp. FR-008]|nr:hypothetical protein SFR_3018 [Streptomyces sp. FR-008]
MVGEFLGRDPLGRLDLADHGLGGEGRLRQVRLRHSALPAQAQQLGAEEGQEGSRRVRRVVLGCHGASVGHD